MLFTAVVVLVAGLIAALLGFTPIAGATFGAARVVAALCVIIFFVLLYRSRAGTRQV